MTVRMTEDYLKRSTYNGKQKNEENVFPPTLYLLNDNGDEPLIKIESESVKDA